MVVVAIALAWPKEASQPIFLTSRDNVDVEMGNALTDSVVQGHECAFSPKTLFHGTRQQLGIDKQRANELSGHIIQGGKVLLWNEQTMSWEYRTMVQKGHG